MINRDTPGVNSGLIWCGAGGWSRANDARLANMSGPGNGRVSGGVYTASIIRNTNGTPVTLLSMQLPPGPTPGHIKFSVIGSTLQLLSTES
jgi:hypothetical protein